MSDPLEIDAIEAKAAFAALLDRLERGEEIVITRDGRAVAMLVRFERESVTKSGDRTHSGPKLLSL